MQGKGVGYCYRVHQCYCVSEEYGIERYSVQRNGIGFSDGIKLEDRVEDKSRVRGTFRVTIWIVDTLQRAGAGYQELCAQKRCGQTE